MVCECVYVCMCVREKHALPHLLELCREKCFLKKEKYQFKLRMCSFLLFHPWKWTSPSSFSLSFRIHPRLLFLSVILFLILSQTLPLPHSISLSLVSSLKF